jgi:hypothetical protein
VNLKLLFCKVNLWHGTCVSGLIMNGVASPVDEWLSLYTTKRRVGDKEMLV